MKWLCDQHQAIIFLFLELRYFLSLCAHQHSAVSLLLTYIIGKKTFILKEFNDFFRISLKSFITNISTKKFQMWKIFWIFVQRRKEKSSYTQQLVWFHPSHTTCHTLKITKTEEEYFFFLGQWFRFTRLTSSKKQSSPYWKHLQM